ncbi:MAG: hypothetical protein QNJ37_24050 [Crocosphaera sp.]|nr:hypothetical protein [Crocosphaera sp.]
MAIIKVGLNVQVVGGPVASVAPLEFEVEAYDKIEVSLESGQPAKIVDVQPGADSVNFLLIKSSEYTPPDAPNDKQLTYKIDDKPAINLDQPQIYLGAGAISSLLGDVKKITFENKLESSEPITANIEILVGRDATPPTS